MTFLISTIAMVIVVILFCVAEIRAHRAEKKICKTARDEMPQIEQSAIRQYKKRYGRDPTGVHGVPIITDEEFEAIKEPSKKNCPRCGICDKRTEKKT